MKTVLYFGIFDKEFSRNKVYSEGLVKNGINVIFCTDQTKGLIKYLILFKKLFSLRNSYDAMIVGYPGYIVVPFARIFSIIISVLSISKQKPIFFDAMCSFYEAQIISRDAYRGIPLRIQYVKAIDWISTRCADKVFVESNPQKEYFVNTLGVRDDKVVVVYTGVDEDKFSNRMEVAKSKDFTVLFRGRITKEAGLKYVLEAIEILRNEDIKFLIIGFGWGKAVEEFNSLLSKMKTNNLVYISKHLPNDELNNLMLSCNVSLGQFGDDERLKRTIPHKAYESLVLGLPYITSRSEGVLDIFRDRVNCIMVHGTDSKDLALKIIELKNSPALVNELISNGKKLYQESLSADKIVKPIIKLL